jgi:serine/threonine protein phosphatase PrpC
VTHAYGSAVDAVIKQAMDYDSTDNLSVIVLGFKNLANSMISTS